MCPRAGDAPDTTRKLGHVVPSPPPGSPTPPRRRTLPTTIANLAGIGAGIILMGILTTLILTGIGLGVAKTVGYW